jgi:hypothetical protein
MENWALELVLSDFDLADDENDWTNILAIACFSICD